ncbi:MAG: hypothetical protein N2D54_00230, partial [Chloroflexota bacterium]
LRAEDMTIIFSNIVLPIWLMGLPMMALVSAAAVFFESVPFLQGGFGNVAYYFLWMAGIVTTMETIPTSGDLMLPVNDFMGFTYPVSDIQQTVKTLFPDYQGSFSIGSSGFRSVIEIFEWHGVDWSTEIVLARVGWLLVAGFVAILGALFFDRFDPAKRMVKEKKPSRMQRLFNRWSAQLGFSPPELEITKMAALEDVYLTQIPTHKVKSRFFGIFLAELRLMLSGKSWWWFTVFFGVNIAGLVNTTATSLEILLNAMVWPVLEWSTLGIREQRYHTEKIVFSAPYPLERQRPATWLGGVFVGGMLSFGTSVRLLLSGEWAHLLGLVIGICFVSALGLALGVWSGSGRFFQIVYLVWWYLAVNGEISLDFLSITQAGIERGTPMTYLVLMIGLMFAAGVGRRLRLQY